MKEETMEEIEANGKTNKKINKYEIEQISKSV
jgi:hypothetical protein